MRRRTDRSRRPSWAEDPFALGREVNRHQAAQQYAPSAGGAAAAPPAAAAPVVPFDQASHIGFEPGPVFTVTPTTSQQQLGPIALPAQGYIRNVHIEVTSASGVAGTGGTYYPSNIFALQRLQDTNGAPLCECTGYHQLLHNTYGGFADSPDPRNDPDYSSSASNPSIQLKIPVEIAPTGLGALANMSAAAAYRLTLIVDTVANIWSVAPTTIPTFTIRTFVEFWTLPAEADALGRQQQREPPFHGVAQYLSSQPQVTVPAGAASIVFTRVGNLIRGIYMAGKTSGSPSDAWAPDPMTFYWDNRDLRIVSFKTWRKIMKEYLFALNARDTGVLVFPFSYGEHRSVGQNEINSWLPTVAATRLSLNGSTPSGGLVDLVVNDVSVAATHPAARAVETSATGFHPPVATGPMAAQ